MRPQLCITARSPAICQALEPSLTGLTGLSFVDNGKLANGTDL